MRLFLIRHGQVEPASSGRFYGGTEVPLSTVGEQEARCAARYIADQELDYVVSSPLSRACFGAEQVLRGRQKELPWHQDPAFREIDRGNWVGLTPEELEIRSPGEFEAHLRDPQNWRGNGGESLEDLRIRVLSGLKKIRQLGHGKAVALISHMFPTRAIVADALGLDLFAWRGIEIPTASVSLIEFDRAGKASVIYQGRKPFEVDSPFEDD